MRPIQCYRMRDPTKAGDKASSEWTDINDIVAHGSQIEHEERGERSAEQPEHIRSLVSPSRNRFYLTFRHGIAKSRTSTAPDGNSFAGNYPMSIVLFSKVSAKLVLDSQLMHVRQHILARQRLDHSRLKLQPQSSRWKLCDSPAKAWTAFEIIEKPSTDLKHLSDF